MYEMHMHAGAVGTFMYGLYVCTGDNPLACRKIFHSLVREIIHTLVREIIHTLVREIIHSLKLV